MLLWISKVDSLLPPTPPLYDNDNRNDVVDDDPNFAWLSGL